MRAGYLLLSMLVMAGLTACQQESTSITTVTPPETTTPSQQATQPEMAGQVTTPITESTPEAAKEIVENATKEMAAIEKVDTNKAVIEEQVKEVATPASPTSPAVQKAVVISSPVAEKPAEVTMATQEVKPTTTVEKASGDPLQGVKVARKCAACHTFDQGGRSKMGPNLFGVFGRIKGAVTGFKYGSYLKTENAAREVWNEASLRSWNTNSKAIAKAAGGISKMPAQKITGIKADDLIAYLKILK
jgi:cytochrome c2